MTHLDLNDTEADALTALLTHAIDDDRYPLSPRIRTLKDILAKLRPQPARPLMPPPLKVYEQPSKGRYRPRDR